jgi:hypothetical protein
VESGIGRTCRTGSSRSGFGQGGSNCRSGSGSWRFSGRRAPVGGLGLGLGGREGSQFFLPFALFVRLLLRLEVSTRLQCRAVDTKIEMGLTFDSIHARTFGAASHSRLVRFGVTAPNPTAGLIWLSGIPTAVPVGVVPKPIGGLITPAAVGGIVSAPVAIVELISG